MPPSLATPDGKAVDATAAADAINRRFDTAMNDDGPDAQAPPKRPQAPPPDDAPKPRRARPRAEDKARAEKTTTPAVVKDDYTDEARQLIGTVWTVAASVSISQPYAIVINNNAGNLASALAEGAKHSAMIRGWVATGESSWILGLAGVGVSMGMQAYQLARDPELRELAAARTREQLKEALAVKGIVIDETEPEAEAA